MFQTILVGIDGSERTEAVLTIASGLARACGAALHVLCAVDPAYFLEEPDGERPSAAEETDYPAPAIEREGADNLVHRSILALRQQGFAADGSVVPGEPAECILKAAHELGCDAIVLGHRHLSWLGRLAEDSVCPEVLERTSLPVVVVPSDNRYVCR